MDRRPNTPVEWDEYRFTTVGAYLLEFELDFFREVLGDAARQVRLLDVGCGAGAVSMRLLKEAGELVALDYDAPALSKFRTRSATVPLVRGNAEMLPMADGSFDCVTALECLQYLEMERFLEQAARVLRPEGMLIFGAINRNNYKRLGRRVLGRAEELGPSYQHTASSVRAATESAGFEIVTMRGYNWPPFDRDSNAAIVPLLARLERMLGLNRLVGVSPWVIVAARRLASGKAIQ